jgi:cytochrome P450
MVAGTGLRAIVAIHSTFLSQLLALMARQQTFVLYPESSELTTKQAAELLGVSIASRSRPFGSCEREKRIRP